MNNNNEKIINLPNGEKVQVKIPEAPLRDVVSFTTNICKFHIPKTLLETQLQKGIWPNPKITDSPLGTTQNLPEGQWWTGTEGEWRAQLKDAGATKAEKRIAKIKALRKAQQALKKLDKEDWLALNAIFTIQRQFRT